MYSRARNAWHNAFCFRGICALLPFVRLLPSMKFTCSNCGCSQFTNVFNPSSAEIVFRKSPTGSTEVERWWKLINHSCLPVIDVHDWSNKHTLIDFELVQTQARLSTLINSHPRLTGLIKKDGYCSQKSNFRCMHSRRPIIASQGRLIYTVQLLLATVACNALTPRIVQCRLTLQLATTVRYNTKKVAAFWRHALKAYDKRKRQLHETVVRKTCTVWTGLYKYTWTQRELTDINTFSLTRHHLITIWNKDEIG
jgi:hypothetical protein